jgi:metal-dependent amidase/aminoacylase/carboxypeptidase family protein
MMGTITDASIRRAIAEREPLVRDVMRFIHDHPELAHAEVASADFLARTLEEL